MRELLPVDVRRATPADAASIRRLALEVQEVHASGRPDLFKPGGGETEAELATRIASDQELYWVATLDSGIIGYAYARVHDEPDSRWRYAARALVLDQMGVDAGHRSRGVGEQLWRAVRAEATTRGADRVILNVWSFNDGARRFYERIGFSPFHERMAVELTGTPVRGAPSPAAPNDFLDIVAGERGHFRFESGHHSDRWLDLDALFANPATIAPWADRLAAQLRPHAVSAVCGPLTGGAFLAQLVADRLGAAFAFTDRVAAPNADGMYAVRYPLRASLASTVRGQRTAIVDDVVSAGSAARGTYGSLVAAGASPVVVGALLVVGSEARRHFREIGVPVVGIAESDGMLWLPAECPLCAAGVPLVDRTG